MTNNLGPRSDAIENGFLSESALFVVHITPHSCADPENAARGRGAGNFFQWKTYFAECRVDLPREAIGPESECRDAKLYVSLL